MKWLAFNLLLVPLLLSTAESLHAQTYNISPGEMPVAGSFNERPDTMSHRKFSGSTVDEVLNRYIQEAFANNLLLKEKNLSLEKSLVALKQAKSLFLPNSSFDGQYISAKGGRTIDIPVGTLMNPVYSTLNQLTNSTKFPQIEDASVQLNPDNFYDVRLRTTMPVINREISINKSIRKEQIHLKENDVAIYKRELVREIKSAYFNYLSATQAIRIYESALSVVNQNLKINRSLLANGKGLPAYVSRAEAEVSKVQQQVQNAVNDQQNAKAYFNFLLNKTLDEPIEIAEQDSMQSLPDTNSVIAQREELKNLEIGAGINQELVKMAKSFRTPKVNLFLDLGSQASNFVVNRQSLFYLGGVQVTVPLFAGKSNLYKIEQAKLDAQVFDFQKDNNTKQLQLSATISRNNVRTAYNSYKAFVQQEYSSQKYFHLINRGYQEGTNSFIEFLDARNQLTTAQLQLNIQKYKVLTQLADLERQTASYKLD